jgi:pimeloyl-ACP methyl ester carboxylesterase
MTAKTINSFDSTEIFYQVNRAGDRCIIFLHGWCHNHTVWEKEMDYFTKKGYSTIAMDLRGHGMSGKPDSLDAYRFECFAKDLDCIIKEEQIKDFVIAGHSFGGMVTISFYGMFPEDIHALVLVDTSYEDPVKHMPLIEHFHLVPIAEHILKFILKHEHIQKKHFPDVDFSKFKDHDDFFYWLKGAEDMPWKSILACLEDILELDKEAIVKKISVPTLILEGSKDTTTPVDISEHMAKDIRDAELKMIPNASHDTNIRRVCTVEIDMDDFLSRIGY